MLQGSRCRGDTLGIKQDKHDRQGKQRSQQTPSKIPSGTRRPNAFDPEHKQSDYAEHAHHRFIGYTRAAPSNGRDAR